MAVRLRIRHKLMLGLALVLGLLILSLGGAIQALNGYWKTLRTMGVHTDELEIIHAIREDIHQFKQHVENRDSFNLAELKKITDGYSDHLSEYRKLLRISKAMTPRTEEEKHLAKLEELLDTLRNKLNKSSEQIIFSVNGNTTSNGKAAVDGPNSELLAIHNELQKHINSLMEIVETAVHQIVLTSKSTYHNHQILAVLTCGSAFLLLFLLSKLLYRWIAAPIKELQTKVALLGTGQMEGRLEIKSGDEMQDLAEAFNNMNDRFQAMYRDLEKQVQERSKQLVRSERLAGIGFLAAGVAHEINNPLSSITFGAEALERRIRPILLDNPQLGEAETIQRYLKMIQDESKRCKGITQKLLEFSRVSDKPRELTDVAELLQSVLSMVQCLPSHSQKRIVVDLKHRPHLWISAPEVKQVMLNLAVNALESMDSGGVLTINLEIEQDSVLLNFTDTGCGMDEAVLDNLFEPFFTRSRTGKGTGLGLSISHRIISQHGGAIEAKSPGINLGSTFTIRLPLKLTEAPTVSTEGANRKAA